MNCKGIYSYNLAYSFWYDFCHYKVQFLWCTYQTHFGAGTSQKVVLRLKSKIANIRVYKCVFTRVVIKIKTFHSCSTCFTLVSIVSHSCRTHVALMLLVSGTRVVKWTRLVANGVNEKENLFLIFLASKSWQILPPSNSAMCRLYRLFIIPNKIWFHPVAEALIIRQ